MSSSRGNNPGTSTNHASGIGQSDSEARMRLAVSGAASGTSSREELYAAAAQLVSELKNANQPPEQMLLQIKQILAESGLRPTYATPNDPATPVGVEASVYRDVITWSIRHYYADGHGSDGRSTDGSKPN